MGSAGLKGADDGVEVGPGIFDAQTAEAIVAAKLNDDDGGFQDKDVVEAVNAIFGSVSTDALVDDVVMVTFGVQVGLEVVGVTLAGFGSMASSETVAKAHNSWTRV
jgi:hypothetical protein